MIKLFLLTKVLSMLQENVVPSNGDQLHLYKIFLLSTNIFLFGLIIAMSA